MGKPFEKTMGMVNKMAKPALEFLSALEGPDFKLQVLRLKDAIRRFEALDEAAKNPDRNVALFEFGLTPQLFFAFDCVPLCLETFPMAFTANSKDVFHAFIDAAESAGVPSDVCSTDRFVLGAALSGEFPENAFFVASSAPCDGTRVAYPIMKQKLGIPALFLEAPYTYEREAAQWYAQQIKTDLIPFLEQVTKKKFDEDRFREIIEESNKAYELMTDIFDAYSSKPCPIPASLRGFPYMNFISGAGDPTATDNIRVFHNEVFRRLKEGNPHPVEEKHRVVWIHVPPTFDAEFFTWMEQKLGASVITSMLTATPILDPIDTTSLDTMLEGYAWQGLDMTMSVMRFDTKKLLEFSMKIYNQYRCDTVIVTQHVGCNSICGASGIMRRYFQDQGIPALFIELDYNDDRVLSSDPLREQIEDFFATITA